MARAPADPTGRIRPLVCQYAEIVQVERHGGPEGLKAHRKAVEKCPL